MQPMAGVVESGDRSCGQLRLGREEGLLVQARGTTALGVGGPRARHIPFPVHRRVPAAPA